MEGGYPIRSPLMPLALDLSNHVVGTGRVQPENLNGVRTSNLHFQTAADRRELQMFLCRSDGCDDAQSDLRDVRTISGRFDSRDRTRNHGRMPPVEIGASKKTFGVGHAKSVAPFRNESSITTALCGKRKRTP